MKMHHAVRATALTGLVAVVATTAGASLARQGAVPGQQPVYGANVELVLVDVAVLGDGDVPVEGLTTEDFRVEEDDEERAVGVVMNASGAPLDVALVIDLSGSMTDTPWQARAAAFLSALDPDTDCVYLMGFSSGVGASIWARPDHPALVESLQLSRAIGGTALFDATVAAADQIAAAGGTDLASTLRAWEADLYRPGPQAPILAGDCPVPLDPADALDPRRRRRRAIVMVTDGEDWGSGYSDVQARLAVLAAGVPVFHIDVEATNSAGPRRLPRGISTAGPAAFDRIVEDSGGTRIPASAAAYEELLNHLRGFYVVGYYVPRPDPEVRAEIERHELRIRLPDRDADVLYARVDYRPTIDRLRVESELAEARRQLQGGDPQGALFAAENALAADPSWSPSYVTRAEIFEDLGRLDEAAADALAAADLAPGDAETHRLAARLAAWVGATENAWEQGIRAAQAGAAMEALFDSLALATEPPADIAKRLEAPRLALVVGPSRKDDVFARAALGKAMLAVGRALEAAPLLGVSRSREDADFIVRVSDDSIDEKPPRRFRGRITVTTAAGNEIYDEGFTLDDLDDRARNAEDLTEKVSEIAEKIARESR
ncbi:MAG: hypothetical protein PVJ49_07965 [Acidobacteriota bacterium]